MSFGAGPFDLMFSIVPVFIVIVFVIVIGIIVINVIKGISTWKYNNSQPVLTVPAEVVSRRSDVTGNMSNAGAGNGIQHRHVLTTYYVTFEVESGDRLEFLVPDREYGMVVEGDSGKVTFQGTRYLGFVRIRNTTLT